jgi:hypothetical protein
MLKIGNTDAKNFFWGSDGVKAIALGKTVIFHNNDVLGSYQKTLTSTNTSGKSHTLDYDGTYWNHNLYNKIIAKITIIPTFNHDNTIDFKARLEQKASGSDSGYMASLWSDNVTLTKNNPVIVEIPAYIPGDFKPEHRKKIYLGLFYQFTSGTASSSESFSFDVTVDIIGLYEI